MTQKLRPLEKIQEMLKAEEVASKYYPPTKEFAKACLLTHLPSSGTGEKILRICADIQELSLAPSLKQKKRTYLLLDYDLSLSLPIKEGFHASVALGILFINRQIPFGNFQIDAIDDHIYLHHSQMLSEDSLDKELLTGTIGALMLYSDLFASPLNALASGEISYRELMEQVIEKGKEGAF
jgi:hypothetical protein